MSRAITRTFAFSIVFLISKLASAQNIPFIKAEQLFRWKDTYTDTVYVINFWASWCKPCVDELPGFERLNREFAGKKVKVILLSSDFKKQVATKLKPLVKQKKLKSTVLYMDEPTPNTWINWVDKSWSGAIPATLIICKAKGFEQFYEKQMKYSELFQIVKPLTEN